LALALKVVGQNRLGDIREAAATAEAALALTPHVDEATAARVLNNIAVYYVESGDLAKAAQFHREQAAMNHHLGDRATEANALSNLGYDYALLGMYPSARAALEQALHMHQAIGARRESAYALLNLGLAHWRSGDVHAAREALEQAQIDLAAVDDTFGRAAGMSYLGLVLEQLGNVDGAQWRFDRAREIFDGMGVRGCAADASAGLARCALAQGNRDAARRQVMEVWAYLQQHGSQGMEFPIWAYLTCAEISELLGESDQSRAVVEEGYRDLIQRARKISNIEWGKSFLENVPEHRAMLDMWDRVAAPSVMRPNP